MDTGSSFATSSTTSDEGPLGWLGDRLRRRGGSHVRLLLVEDGEADARYVGYLTDGWGDVTHVSRVDAACVALREGDPELVLLDLGLPDASGLDALVRIRAEAPDLPVVVLTGHGPEMVTDALRLGAQDFLSKDGLDEVSLLRSVVFALERHHLVLELDKQRRAAMQDASDLERILGASVDAVAVLDLDGNVLVSNGLGRRVCDGRYEELAAHVGGNLELEVEDCRFAVSVQSVQWRGSRALWVSAHDLAERRAAEKADLALRDAEHMAALGRLAAEVAHEINNPLAFIHANLSVARGKVTDAEVEALLAESGEGVERVAAIVADMQTWARADPAMSEPVSLTRVAWSALTLLRSRLRRRPVEVETKLDDTPSVDGSEGRLVQVATNLITNALDAIDSEGTIRVETGKTARGEAFLRVSDDGSGMSAEVLAAARRPFFSTKQEHGMGLGLSVCDAIAEEHRGTLEIESERGEGTTVSLILPPGRRPSQRPKPVRKATRRRLLLIDDDPQVRRAYRRLLSVSHDLETVSGLESALARLAEDGDFDLILCDVEMPDVAGPTAAERIAQAFPALRVVLYSGGVFSPEAKEQIAAGGWQVLPKPLPLDRLQALLEEL